MNYLLIDGNNVMFAHQLANSKLTAGEVETTAVFGLLGTLRLLAEKYPGWQQIVLWDSSPTWRHREFPEYKSNRDANPQTFAAKEALKPQRKLAQWLLPYVGVEQFIAKGYEADDLAGYLSTRLSKREALVMLVSNDQDWLQLVDRNVSWLDPRTDIRNGGTIVSLMGFEQHTGYETPEKFLTGKCLRGDTSDTISGVGGIGEGTAQLLMQHFEDVGDLAANWSKRPELYAKKAPFSRVKKKVEAFIAPGSPGMEIYFRNRRLMDLRDVKVPDPVRTPGAFNPATFQAACRRLSFLSILKDADRWLQPFNPLPKAA